MKNEQVDRQEMRSKFRFKLYLQRKLKVDIESHLRSSTLKGKFESHFFGYSSCSNFKQNLPERHQKSDNYDIIILKDIYSFKINIS